MPFRVIPAQPSPAQHRPSLAKPDAAWEVQRGGKSLGHCSAWWSATPEYAEHKLSVIGGYHVEHDAAAEVLLQHVMRCLVAQGCTYVLGPMDHNTWHDYRFVVDSDGRPPFFLEPRHGARGVHQFEASGFHRLAHFFSAHVEDLSIRTCRIDRLRARFRRDSLHIRALNRQRFVAEMQQIYQVAAVAFQEHLLYVPISEAQFMAMYQPLESTVANELILLAEQAGRVVGFCFAVPDVLQTTRHEPLDTIVVKTFGVLPERRFAGLGQLLLEEVHHRAAAAGFRRGIHALVAEGGAVQRISSRYATPFRRYALFGRELS